MTTATHTVRFAALGLATLALLLADVMFGSVSLTPSEVWSALTSPDSVPATTVQIVWQIRVIKAAVALLAGMALSVSGAQMQTLFRNPLAGPYVLGISAGASLGVALLLLGSSWIGGDVAAWVSHSSLSIAGAAWIGAALVLLLVVAVSTRIKDIMMILILGVMFSSAVSSIVQILQYVSREEALKTFVVWTMGSLGEVTSGQLVVLAALWPSGWPWHSSPSSRWTCCCSAKPMHAPWGWRCAARAQPYSPPPHCWPAASRHFAAPSASSALPCPTWRAP